MTRHRHRIAIACRGGGSHRACTAGVLSALLQRPRAEDVRRRRREAVTPTP